MITIVQAGGVHGAKGVMDGEQRSDHSTASRSIRSGGVLRWRIWTRPHSGQSADCTLVPTGTQIRIGVDRDGDGIFDASWTHAPIRRSPERPCCPRWVWRRGDVTGDGSLT
jgi:hypothetical protein